MIDYTLKIDTYDVVREVNGFKDVITRLIWTMTGQDGDLTATTSASTDLPEPTEGQPFTAFADLTAETLIGWVEEHTDACRGEGYLDERKVIVAEAIEKARNPYVPPKEPWIEEAEPTAEDVKPPAKKSKSKAINPLDGDHNGEPGGSLPDGYRWSTPEEQADGEAPYIIHIESGDRFADTAEELRALLA